MQDSDHIDVSVVIPAYNGESFIAEAVQSCLNQASAGFRIEVVVVDDASTDRTCAILSSFDGRVRLIRHERNTGRHVGRNHGLQAATGTFVKFLDQDDFLEPATLQKEFDLGVRENADIVVAGHRYVTSDGKTASEKPIPRPMDPRVQAILDGCAVPTAAALYRRSYISGLEWDGNVPRLDDWDWFVRAALRMGKIVPISHVSYSWRKHPQQYTHSSTLDQYARDHHIVLDKIEAWLKEHNEFTTANRGRLAQYYYKMLRAIYKHDKSWYRRTIAHIIELEPKFQPYCEPRREVRWLCRFVGIHAGLFLYNRAADLTQNARSWLASARPKAAMGHRQTATVSQMGRQS